MRYYLLLVDIGGCLVHQEDGVMAEDGPGQTHQLPLPHTQVGASLRHNVPQPEGKVLYCLLQLNLIEPKEKVLNY